MVTQATPPGKRETFNLRLRREEWDLIDRAAKVRGKSRREFVLDAALKAAEETWPGQVPIAVSRETYAGFVAQLDRPVQPDDALRKTLGTLPPWDDT